MIAQANKPRSGRKIILPALFAVTGGLGALPAAALELGEVAVHSSLGQPLSASIAFALAPTEELSNTCVSLQRASSAGGLPVVSDATISIANGVISLTGKNAIREPMLTMRVNIKCPYTPNLSREYMLFVDPPGTVAMPTTGSTVTATVEPTSISQSPATTRRPVVASNTPIGDVTSYQVQRGETLSEIVQRIENRPVGLWNTVMVIFEANPDAFINNDPNMLKAGSWISIPDFSNPQASVVADTEIQAPATQPTASNVGVNTTTDAGVDNIGSAYAGIDANDGAASTTLVDDLSTVDSETIGATAALADLQPGDVILDSDNPLLTAVGSSGVETIILDTPLAAPDVAPTPNGTVMSVRTPGNETTSSNWLLWLAGSGVAIIIGLLLFGRRFRDRFASTPIAPVVESPQRRQSDSGNNTETLEAVAELDYGLSDDSPTEENLVLDADLIAGTGLEQGTDMHLAQDFGFAATTQLDVELPEEMSSGGNTMNTDIIPPIKMDMQSILESEVLPGEGDYDMSVIVDATQMPRPEDVTERDLKAVAININDETLISDDYSVSKDADLNVLEQDYEDELTATQVLNQEIAKAAVDLAERMDEITGDDSGDVTREMPLANVSDLDVTTQMPAKTDSAVDPDDTGIREDRTAEFAIDDKTVEMPANDADVTAEIQVESDKADSKTG